MSPSASDNALAHTIASATAEQINIELAKRGWKLAYDVTAQQGESLPSTLEERVTLLEVDALFARRRREACGGCVHPAHPGRKECGMPIVQENDESGYSRVVATCHCEFGRAGNR